MVDYIHLYYLQFDNVCYAFHCFHSFSYEISVIFVTVGEDYICT